MEKIKILGVDPSIRHTGLAVLNYDCEKEEFSVTDCQILKTPKEFKGREAIVYMLNMLHEISDSECYTSVNHVIVESPPKMFNAKLPSSVVSNIAHISGAAIALFGIKKGFLVNPTEWNRSKKKDVTHGKIVSILGDPDGWHYQKIIKSNKDMEHVLDAVSMAHWWLLNNYCDE